MSPPNDELPVDERMRRLERRARVIRARLLRAASALDARRHQVVAVGERAKEIAKPVALSLLGIAATVGASALAFGLVLKARRRRSLPERASRALGDRLARPARPSVLRRLFERAMFSVVAFAATELAKRMAKNVIDGRMPDGRLAVGEALREHRASTALVPTAPSGG